MPGLVQKGWPSSSTRQRATCRASSSSISSKPQRPGKDKIRSSKTPLVQTFQRLVRHRQLIRLIGKVAAIVESEPPNNSE